MLKKVYLEEYRKCIERHIKLEKEGHYRTKIDFCGAPFYVNADGSYIDVYEFNIISRNKRYIKKYVGKEVKTEVEWFSKPKHLHIGNKYTNLSKFLFSYALFLVCDGITDRDEMRLYILYTLLHKVDYKDLKVYKRNGKSYHKWIEKNPEEIPYKYLKNMVERVITYALNKEITEQIRGIYRHKQCCMVNMLVKDKNGGVRKKTKGEKLGDIQRAKAKINDIKIKNGETEGFCRKTIYNHIKYTKESKKDKIKRLYDENKSLRVNAKEIGVSVNTLQKYIKEIEEDKKNEVVKDEIDILLDEESEFWCVKENKKDNKRDNNIVIDDSDDWLDKLDLDD